MMKDDDPNPTLARRRLAVRLSRLREQSGRGLGDLSKYLGVALPQASRLDTGARGLQSTQVRKLAAWYGLGDAERDELLELAAESRKRAWWQQEKLADSYRTLIGLEKAAESIKEFGGWVVPGLLQTPDYSGASAHGDTFPRVADSGEEQAAIDAAIERAPSIRMRRQEILRRESPPELRVVIDEGVLARTVGGKAVMGAQLEHLVEMAGRPRIEIRVIGFEVGAYQGGSLGHYILLDMGRTLPGVVYAERLGEPEDTSNEVTLRSYRQAWDEVWAKAFDSRTSRALVDWYRSKLA